MVAQRHIKRGLKINGKLVVKFGKDTLSFDIPNASLDVKRANGDVDALTSLETQPSKIKKDLLTQYDAVKADVIAIVNKTLKD